MLKSAIEETLVAYCLNNLLICTSGMEEEAFVLSFGKRVTCGH